MYICISAKVLTTYITLDFLVAINKKDKVQIKFNNLLYLTYIQNVIT